LAKSGEIDDLRKRPFDSSPRVNGRFANTHAENGQAGTPLLDLSRWSEVRVLIADAHRLYGEAIGAALSAHGFKVCGPATTAAEALREATSLRPDLVVLGSELAGGHPTQVGERILAGMPATKIVVVTSASDPAAVAEAMRVGFAGYVMDDAPVDHFIATLHAVLAGHVVVPKRLASAVAGAQSAEQRKALLLAQQLTAREQEVLTLLTRGARGGDMAEQLSISRNTVRTHVQNLLAKLGVHSRLEAAAFALQHGLVPVPVARPSEGRTSRKTGTQLLRR
jgi:two-component system nitrate/nitrite response regulator NarL